MNVPGACRWTARGKQNGAPDGAPFRFFAPPPLFVELVHDCPKRGVGLLREVLVQELVILGTQRLALLAFADLEPARLDQLPHGMRRHRRPPEQWARPGEQPA